ncbi:membrane-bound acid phosphatase 2 [Trypanosoma theileri]|uniref:Membrane-bound acid phosphatase 2 n=1 Tax=Trypanosoma theileri TaxID=67003 RepID=A0A1X0NY34_9TRYP|nr:membrane-bound acid phosphatase 2 [Trypanosoma theileri]ORC89585.1 membrane-bound acid phosphatase 2 [Trypanosoma theileri]
MRRPNVLILTALLLLPLLAFADTRTIKQLSFVHRHGARDEPLVIDGNLVWDYAQLTPNGEKMMANLGKLLRRVYGTFIPSFSPDEYDLLSGDSDRCIQSAYGVAQSFFNETSNFLPFVKYGPVDSDWLMEFNYNFPNIIARSEWYYSYQNNDTLARTMLSEDDILALASEFGDWCSKTPMLCALFAVDAIQCRISNTNETSKQLRDIFQEKLLPIQYGSCKHLYAFHPTNPYAVTGAPGYDLAAKMLNDAQGGNKKVYQYSAHDSTVLGLLNTLGGIQLDDMDEKWFPRFGAVLTLTTYTDGNISFGYAEPMQEENSTLDYSLDIPPVSVRCQTASGLVYLSSECPVEDVWRYVNNSKPTVSDRYCYLLPEDRCDVMDTVPSSSCQYYRKHCPKEACGPNAVLDAHQNYICASFAKKEKISHYALSATLSAVIGAAVGVLLGILIAFFLNKLEEKEDRRRLVSQLDNA